MWHTLLLEQVASRTSVRSGAHRSHSSPGLADQKLAEDQLDLHIEPRVLGCAPLEQLAERTEDGRSTPDTSPR
jgi:hypothetical protein